MFAPTGRLKIGTPTMTPLRMNPVLRAKKMKPPISMNGGTESPTWATPAHKVRGSVTITQRKEKTSEKWEEQATSMTSHLSMSLRGR